MVVFTDEFKKIVDAVKTSLSLSVLNYDFGPVRELNQKMALWNASTELRGKFYPLVWLKHPFTIHRPNAAIWGETKDLTIFIICDSSKDYMVDDRIANVFKPKIYPIYEELLKQILVSPMFSTTDRPGFLVHDFTEMYELSLSDDLTDCGVISNLELLAYQYENNCQPFSNL